MAYKIYRMYKGNMIANSHGAGYHGNNFSPTARTFKGRNVNEATNKMDKFLKSAQIVGSFFLKEIA